MKPLKLLCIAMIPLFFSCEPDTIVQPQGEEEAAFTLQTTANSTRGTIKRNLLKARNNGLRKVVVVLENDPGNDVASIEVEMQAQMGVEVSPNTFTLVPKSTTPAGDTRFVYNTLSLEGEDPDGQVFTALITQKSNEGETIGETQVNYFTAQDNDMINMTKPKLKMKKDGETFKLRMAVTGSLSSEVSNVNVTLTPVDGGAEAEQENFDLELIKETDNNRVFRARTITFGDFDNVVDMEYLAAVSLTDSNGEEIDYATFRIVGTENIEEPPVTAFGTPSLNFIEDLQQFGITIPVNGPSNTAVNDVLVTITPTEDGSPAIDSQVVITEFEETPTGRIFKALISFENPENVIGNEYFIETQEFECEDQCLVKDEGNYLCGQTDHL